MRSKISGKQCLQSVSCPQLQRHRTPAPLPKLSAVVRKQLEPGAGALAFSHRSAAFTQPQRGSCSWFVSIAHPSPAQRRWEGPQAPSLIPRPQSRTFPSDFSRGLASWCMVETCPSRAGLSAVLPERGWEPAALPAACSHAVGTLPLGLGSGVRGFAKPGNTESRVLVD